MAENVQVVYIGDAIVSDKPDDVLVAYGLGSCVAVCLYDPLVQVGGMLHALLPTAPDHRGRGNPAKFVDQGVPLLIDALHKMGARRSRLIARLCGGAQLLFLDNVQNEPGFNGSRQIGKLNVEMAEAALQSARIPILARAVGGHAGRTVRLHLADGRVTVKTLEEGEWILK